MLSVDLVSALDDTLDDRQELQRLLIVQRGSVIFGQEGFNILLINHQMASESFLGSSTLPGLTQGAVQR